MLSASQIIDLGIAPKGFKISHTIYQDPKFTPVTEITHEVWKRLPLHIQVCYSYEQPHKLI